MPLGWAEEADRIQSLLSEDAKGAPQGSRGDLSNVHGHESCAESAEEADNQSAQDQHFN